MACLILIQYHKCWYSVEIKPKINEVADLFNVSRLSFVETTLCIRSIALLVEYCVYI